MHVDLPEPEGPITATKSPASIVKSMPCNAKNAASPSSLCAERTTLFYANSRYPDQPVDTLAIAAHNERGEFLSEPIPPCGACRQVMLETEKRYNHPMRILLYGTAGIYEIQGVSGLLPLSFDASAMK